MIAAKEGKPSVVNELKRIAAKNGGVLKAECVVAEARDPDSPLHDSFDWNDTEAASKWRLHQARNIIRVAVEYINTGKGEPVKVSAFVSLTPDREQEGGGYRSIVAVLRRKDHREQMLDDAMKELRVFEDKYASLTELASVFAAARKVRAAVKG